ncbi:MAG: response regulator transcription factor [Campylobacterales bacterium]|nr:response regulator transcription factor [Campylobacterales bacterium]
MKILLLEDDVNLHETVKEELEDEGLEVSSAYDSDTVLDLTYENKFDLYIFDVNVPGMDGFETLRSLRDAGDNTPTLFLTSKSEMKDLKSGFDSGADDYITKPFKIEELLIRISRFMKKTSKVKISKTVFYNEELHRLEQGDDYNQINKKEAEFLNYFLSHPNQICSKDEVVNEIYEDNPISDATFRVYVKNIKKAAFGVEVLKNIRGEGYIFEEL